jgi:hypothetical protein
MKLELRRINHVPKLELGNEDEAWSLGARLKLELGNEESLFIQ